MRRGKKTIRLTESEMVSMIERIVNEVKREKRNQISESRYSRRRYLMEQMEEEAMGIEAEWKKGGGEPTPKILQKIEDFLSKGKEFGEKLSGALKSKLRLHFRKNPKSMKRFKNISTQCPKWD